MNLSVRQGIINLVTILADQPTQDGTTPTAAPAGAGQREGAYGEGILQEGCLQLPLSGV